MSYRSALSRAKGLGAAKSGSHHFVYQRLTAIALVPLSIWITYSVVCLGRVDLMQAREFVGHPLNATLLMCLLIAGFYHANLGLQVVLEDYLRPHGLRLVLQIGLTFLSVILAMVSVLAVIRIAVVV